MCILHRESFLFSDSRSELVKGKNNLMKSSKRWSDCLSMGI